MLQHTDKLNRDIAPMIPGGKIPPRYLQRSDKAKRINPEYVRWCFESEGYKLLNDYTGQLDPLYFICPQGHHHFILWSNWVKGKRCGRCSHNRRLTKEIITERFKTRGCTLTDKNESFRFDSYLYYICPNGHEHQILWRNFFRGVGCPYCTWGKNERECTSIFDQLKDCGYVLIKPYIKSTIKVVYQNPKGDTRQMYWRSLKPRLYKILEDIKNDGKYLS